MRATWPFSARWTSAAPRLIGQTLRPPQQSINGTQTILPSLSAHWQVEGSFVVHGEAQELAWQAFIAQMEGGVGTTLVPIWSRYRPRDNRGRQTSWERTSGLSDDSGSTLYGHDSAQTWEHFGLDNAPVTIMSLAQPAALRATTIKVTSINSNGIRPGQYFSLGERLYRVQNHWQDADGTSNLMIQPPLRQAFTAAALILDRPVCVMRLTEESGELEYTPDGVAHVDVTFVEAV